MNTKTPPPHEAICMQNGVLRESHRYKDIRLYVLWDLVRKTILNGGWSVVPTSVDTPIVFEKPNEGLQYLQS